MRLRSGLLVLALLGATLNAVPALAASDCSLDGTTLNVVGEDEASIGRAGENITVEGVPCLGATVSNVDEIVVTDASSDGGVNVYLDLSGGPLGPGATPEATGTSEIEVTLDVGPGADDYDKIYVRGGPDADTFSVGTNGLSLNDDDDLDVTVASDYPNLRIRLEGFGGNDTLRGQGGHGAGSPLDIGFDFFGGDGDDDITGSLGGDRLEGDAGADHIDGGGVDQNTSGIIGDALGYSISPGGVNVDLAAGTATGADAEGDTFVNVNSVTGSDFDDVLLGTDLANGLLGGMGADEIAGRGGDDYLEGGIDGDDLDGGAGIDSINYYSSDEAIQVDLAAGTITGGEGTGDSLAGIEYVAGSNYDDVLLGSAGYDRLDGYYGNDTIEGMGGDDELEDGYGDDVVSGGPGDDWLAQEADQDGSDLLDGGEGFDLVDYWGRDSSLTFSVDGVANDGEAGENDNILAVEEFGAGNNADIITGTGGNDKVRSRGGDDDVTTKGGGDKVNAGDGADQVNGGGGNDVLNGGPGKDVIVGGKGNDTCYVTKGDETKGCEKRAHKRAH